MMLTIRILRQNDASVLDNVAPDVFDNPIDARWTAEFLNDSRHHLAVALDGDQVIGMASGLHYVHPDKPPELYINEVGITPTRRNQGIGRQLLEALFAHARTLGCKEAWLGTEKTNVAARRMYAAVGGEEEKEDMVLVWFEL
jgi:ribosomal protein S18 acetylase RimI-like enzyme